MHDLEVLTERTALSQSRVASELESAIRRNLNPTDLRVPVVSSRRLRDDVSLSVEPQELMDQWSVDPTSIKLPAEEVESLLEWASSELQELPGPLAEIDLPTTGLDPRIVIVGDTHGQLLDALHVLREHGPPGEDCVFIFNGDIADRGAHAVEILILLLAFRFRYPDRVHILRGNHENEVMNGRPRQWGGGFAEECLSKYGGRIYDQFQQLFILLPLFALVQRQIFVVHGGLSRVPHVNIERLRRLPYRRPCPMEPSAMELTCGGGWTTEDEILFDTLWADPHEGLGAKPSPRGKMAKNFGRDTTKQFVQDNDLSLIIRSHQVPQTMRGFALSHDDQLLTVFSASNYAMSMKNRGAVAKIRCGPPPVQSKEPGCGAGNLDIVLPLEKGITVQCVEHFVDSRGLGNRQSDVNKLKQARSAMQVARALSEEEKNIMNESVCNALGLIHLERDRLVNTLSHLDGQRKGFVSGDVLVRVLLDVCGELDWSSLIGQSVNLSGDVDYGKFLRAIHIRWLYLGPEQATAMVRAMCHAELTLQQITTLFDFDGDGMISKTTFRRALRQLLPALCVDQMHYVSKIFGDEPLRLSDVLERLVAFAPPMELQEDWVVDVLPKIWYLIQDWGGHNDPYETLLKFFKTYDEEGLGVLTVPQFVKAVQEVEFNSAQDPLSLDLDKLQAIGQLIDIDNNGSVSFLEIARAHGSRYADVAEALMQESQCSCTSLLFVHHAALLQGCRHLDINGHGHISTDAFVMVVRELARVLNYPLTESQLVTLRTALGDSEFHYGKALSSFRVSLRLTPQR